MLVDETLPEHPAAVVGQSPPANAARLPVAARASAAARQRSGLTYCEAMEDMADPEDCAIFAEVRDRAPMGIASLGAPAQMRLDAFYPVTLIVGREERRAQVERAAGALGQVSTVAVRLAPWICAELDATGFALRGEREQCKQRGGSPQVSFDWEVSPERAGRLSLSATVRASVSRSGGTFEQIDSNRVEVKVEAGLVRQLQEAKEGGIALRELLLVIAGIVAAVSLIVWRLRKMGTRPDQAPVAAAPDA